MRWLRLCLRRAATYFFLTPKKSRRAGYNCSSSSKMPLSCAEGLGTAQTAFVVGRHETACKGGCKMNIWLRDGLARCARWLSLMDFCEGTVGDGFSEGRWNSKAIPIMNELVQMAQGPVPTMIHFAPFGVAGLPHRWIRGQARGPVPTVLRLDGAGTDHRPTNPSLPTLLRVACARGTGAISPCPLESPGVWLPLGA